jgi:hypothetical protein
LRRAPLESLTNPDHRAAADLREQQCGKEGEKNEASRTTRHDKYR